MGIFAFTWSSENVLYSPHNVLFYRGVDLANWRELIETQGCPADMSKFTAHMQNHSLPNTVIIDCTASVKVAEKYYDWMQKRMHIITPNKKANSGPYEQVRLPHCVSVIESVLKVHIART